MYESNVCPKSCPTCWMRETACGERNRGKRTSSLTMLSNTSSSLSPGKGDWQRRATTHGFVCNVEQCPVGGFKTHRMAAFTEKITRKVNGKAPLDTLFRLIIKASSLFVQQVLMTVVQLFCGTFFLPPGVQKTFQIKTDHKPLV